MPTPYAKVVNAFLFKVTEHKFMKLTEQNRDAVVLHYMKGVCAEFNRVCKEISGIDLSVRDDELQQFEADLPDDVVDIISEGMIVRWLKPYAFSSDNLENVMSTKDISLYAPANLLREISAAYKMCKADFEQLIVDFSYTQDEPGT